MVTINGRQEQCAGISLMEYLANMQYDVSCIAVEIGDEIIPKAKYETTLLHDGDVVEIVRFVGGG